MRTRLGAAAFGLLVVAGFTPSAQAQDGGNVAAVEAEAMAKVAFIAGEWEGEGWMEYGDERHEFRGTESVTAMLDGRVLIIEGRHFDPPSGEQVHHAVAVLTYDPDAGHYRFATKVAGRGGTDATATMVDGDFRWLMTTPYGQMRYTIRLDEQGHWQEIGEMSRDGENWRQHFAMTMRRVDS